jgi:hypothetical protein
MSNIADSELEDETFDDEIDGEEESNEGGEDSRLDVSGGSDTAGVGESEEDKRARRREERKAKKLRDRRRLAEAEENLKMATEKIARLEMSMQMVSKNGVAKEYEGVRAQIADAHEAYEIAKEKRKKAMENNDSEMFDAADNIMVEAKARVMSLIPVAKKMEQFMNAPIPAPLDPRIPVLVKQFQKNNAWYDPNGSDEDSQIVKAIDNVVAREGYRPETKAYWEELDRRLRERLPHRFKESPRPPTGGVASTSSDGGSPNSRFNLSEARRKAMLDAGYVEGTKEWQRMAKYYENFDKSSR